MASFSFFSTKCHCSLLCRKHAMFSPFTLTFVFFQFTTQWCARGVLDPNLMATGIIIISRHFLWESDFLLNLNKIFLHNLPFIYILVCKTASSSFQSREIIHKEKFIQQAKSSQIIGPYVSIRHNDGAFIQTTIIAAQLNDSRMCWSMNLQNFKVHEDDKTSDLITYHFLH